jgi:hypothetical protein
LGTGHVLDLLKRTPSFGKLQTWVDDLNHGVTPETVAYGFAASAERERLRVRNDYFIHLGGTPSQPEVDGWVNAFLHGLTNEDLVAGFIASPEYFNGPQKGKSDETDWGCQRHSGRFAAAGERGRLRHLWRGLAMSAW